MNASRVKPCELDFAVADDFLTILYSLVLAVGLPLNCLSLWVLISGIRRKILLSVYMVNLAVAELLQLLTLPFWIRYFHRSRIWDLGPVACASVGLGFVTNLYAKQTFLCLIAFERYIGVIHAMRYRGWQTLLKAAQVSICAWALVALLSTTGYIALRKDTAQNYSTLCYEGYPTGESYVHFKLSTVGLSFIIPCLLMVFFYSSILMKLRKVSSIPSEEKRSIVVLLVFSVVTFFVILGPYHVTSFYKHLVETTLRNDQAQLCKQETTISLYYQVTLGWTTLGNIVNPLVYVLISKSAAVELMKTFTWLPSCWCPRTKDARVPQKDDPPHAKPMDQLPMQLPELHASPQSRFVEEDPFESHTGFLEQT